MDQDQAAVAANDENIFDNASVSTASTSASASSGWSLSASDAGDSSVTSASSGDQPQSVPLVLRLFEHLVRHSTHSDTWRYMLRAASDDMLDYLTGRSSTARCCLEDPFYPGLEHDIKLSRSPAAHEAPAECLSWRISVANRCTVSLALDSTEAAVALTRCHQPELHRRQGAAANGCCHVHCWPIASLPDYAGYLDTAYRRSLLACADEADLMRGKYHGCRRG